MNEVPTLKSSPEITQIVEMIEKISNQLFFQSTMLQEKIIWNLVEVQSEGNCESTTNCFIEKLLAIKIILENSNNRFSKVIEKF